MQFFSLDYLEHFSGKHERMLNNLKTHYRDGDIECFFKFFQEPWTELLMHEHFEDFQAENHKMLTPMLQTLEVVIIFYLLCFNNLIIPF